MGEDIVPQPPSEGNRSDSSHPCFRGYSGPNYTQIPDELFDDQLPDLSGAELKVLLYIMRRTFGFKKQSDNISLSQITDGITTRDGHRLDRGTGLARKTVVAAIKGLVERHYVIAVHRASDERGFEATNYRLNVGQDARPSLVTKGNQGPDDPWVQNVTSPSYRRTPPLVTKSNLQETVKQQTEHVHEQQHMHDMSAREGVVVALLQSGVTKKTAEQLAKRYPEGLIRAQIDMLPYRQASNPAAALVKAIRDDWAPPPGYETPQQREEGARRRAEDEARRAAAGERGRRDREAWTPRMIEERAIDGATLELWERARRQLSVLLGPAAYGRLFGESLLEPPGRAWATVLVPTHPQKAGLKPEHREVLGRVLSGELGREVTVDVRHVP